MSNSLSIKIMNILFEIQDFSLNDLNFIDRKVILEIKKISDKTICSCRKELNEKY